MKTCAPPHKAQVEADAAAASRGDIAALGRLYDRFADRVYRALLVRTSGDRHLAEDLASETWVKVAQRIDRYTPRGGGFPVWLHTIGRNVLNDHYRSAAARREHTTFEDDPVFTAMVDAAPLPDAAVITVEAREAVCAAVKTLPSAQRTALILHHWSGLTLAETAKEMNKSLDSVKALQRRALCALRPALVAYANQPTTQPARKGGPSCRNTSVGGARTSLPDYSARVLDSTLT